MTTPAIDYEQLALQIKQWGKDLGFAEVGITDIDLTKHEAQLQRWLDLGYNGELEYIASHGMKRSRRAELVPGPHRVISVKMNYLQPDARLSLINNSRLPTKHQQKHAKVHSRMHEKNTKDGE